MEFRILGPLEVTDEDRVITLGRGRERELLALLLLSANRVVSSERLAEDLWAGRPPEGAHQALQVYVSRLRKSLRQGGGDTVLVTQPPGYVARVATADLDAARFEALVAEGRSLATTGDHARAAATLREALALWRGPVLADLGDAPFAGIEAARLEEARLAAVEERVEADLACGRHRELIPELDALTRTHPLRERLWAQRMVALYRSDRQAEALRAYHEVRVVLSEELGLEPSASLVRVERAILRHEPELDWPPPDKSAPPAPRAAPSLEGVVTFLFTDLVGSTQLLDHLGEDAAEELRETHFALLREAVAQAGGHEVKSLGDGLMVAFASPLAALGCALAIQRGVADHNRTHPEARLSVRVGLQAGEPTRAEDDYFGTAVVVAKRLCDRAEAGQILVGDLVASLVGSRGDFRFRPLGPLTLKGLANPVPAMALAWHHLDDIGGSEEGEDGLLPVPLPQFLTSTGRVFVGREEELDRLRASWKDAAAGHRRVVLVGGEPGVGKTRLAATVAEELHAQGATVLAGRCDEDLGVPYQPMVEALRHFLDHTPARRLSAGLGRFGGELIRLVPELTERAPGLTLPLRSDPETERYRLFDAVAAWLAAVSVDEPLLLVLDDLQWAPPPTLMLLRHVIRSPGPMRLLILGTYRDTELGPGHPLVELLADLRRDQEVGRLPLAGLLENEVVTVLEEAAGHRLEEDERTLARAVHNETEGNPFFVWEIVRHLVEIGAVVRRQGRWVTGQAVAELGIPEGVRDVVGRRLSRLSAAANDALAVAAVVGHVFDLGVLRAAGGLGEGELVVALDEAAAARLVEERGAGAYRFVHALVRSALYETLSATRRARLHLEVAGAVEQDGAPDAPRLAYHLLAAGPLADRVRTAHACLGAGEGALVVLADAEALDWFSDGLRIITAQDDPDLRLDLLTGLGEAQRRLGDTISSRQTLLDAARLAANKSDAARLVRALLANSRLFVNAVGTVDEEFLELIGVALDLLGPAATPARAELLALQAAELLFVGEHERTLAAADEAAAIAAGLGDAALRARVGVRRFVPSLAPDRVPALTADAAELVALSDGTGDPHLQVWSRAVAGMALLQTGDLEHARSLAAEAMSIADETGQPGLRCISHNFHGTALDAVGEHEEAQRIAEAVPILGQQAGWNDALVWYMGMMFQHWLFAGQAEILVAVAPQISAEYSRMPLAQCVEPAAMAFLGGREEELAAILANVRSVLPTLPVDFSWLGTHSIYALAIGFGVEDSETAAAIHERLLPYRSLHAAGGASMYLAPIEVALGITARAIGDPDVALAHHEAADGIIEACGAARARALNGYQWARTLLARDAPGDRPQATALLQDTLEYSRIKGYMFFVEKCEELLANIR